ncbi:hypothetical protein NPIL_573991 [Nephila pilipes]|uniref:Uncharacterized protein n=1 Tax=Nephila pilipes TaxID=299642 RepID=A0A8X6NIV4_NEPPI|nr:hypothetical protein NPIL_573991 [Nephila pilipes]
MMVGGSKNSPGYLMFVPYIIWAIEWFVSDLMADLKPSSTVGKDSVHLMLLCAFIAFFRVLCCLSIFPFTLEVLWQVGELFLSTKNDDQCRSEQSSMPFEGGSGLVKSILITLNLSSGVWDTPNLDLVCLFTLNFWYLMHVFSQSHTCFFISFQRNFSDICLVVLFTPE